MKRFVLALISTVTGLVFLLGHKSTPAPSPLTLAIAPTTSGSSGAVSSSSGASAAAASAATTYTGPVVCTRYGNVQVQITVVSGKVSEVTAIQVPDGHPHDAQISSWSVPVLRSEVLSAQSADVQYVSGATYTSQGYLQSLQAALDSAGLS